MENLPGRAGAVAHALESQIADLNADIGNIYMGGNTPTDRGLELASKALSADWNDETFHEGLKQARSNVQDSLQLDHQFAAGRSSRQFAVCNAGAARWRRQARWREVRDWLHAYRTVRNKSSSLLVKLTFTSALKMTIQELISTSTRTTAE
jgi:hypothetical protein